MRAGEGGREERVGWGRWETRAEAAAGGHPTRCACSPCVMDITVPVCGQNCGRGRGATHPQHPTSPRRPRVPAQAPTTRATWWSGLAMEMGASKPGMHHVWGVGEAQAAGGAHGVPGGAAEPGAARARAKSRPGAWCESRSCGEKSRGSWGADMCSTQPSPIERNNATLSAPQHTFLHLLRRVGATALQKSRPEDTSEIPAQHPQPAASTAHA